MRAWEEILSVGKAWEENVKAFPLLPIKVQQLK